MKKLFLALAILGGAYMLTGCGSTSNSPAPATSCTINQFGQSVQAGTNTPCVSTQTACGAGTGLTYNPTTGQWINPTTGQAVACGAGAYGYTGSPTGSGYTGGYYGTGGCTYWDSVYPGNNYVPAYDPTGNLVCLNLSNYGITIPSNYNYSQPIYVMNCPYGDTYSCQNYWNSGGYYSGYGYGYPGYGSGSGYYSGGGTCIGGGTDSFMIGICL